MALTSEEKANKAVRVMVESLKKSKADPDAAGELEEKRRAIIKAAGEQYANKKK